MACAAPPRRSRPTSLHGVARRLSHGSRHRRLAVLSIQRIADSKSGGVLGARCARSPQGDKGQTRDATATARSLEGSRARRSLTTPVKHRRRRRRWPASSLAAQLFDACSPRPKKGIVGRVSLPAADIRKKRRNTACQKFHGGEAIHPAHGVTYPTRHPCECVCAIGARPRRNPDPEPKMREP